MSHTGALGPRAEQELRRARRGAIDRRRPDAGRARRPDRPEWRRQDDIRQSPHRLSQPGCRDHRARRHADRKDGAGGSRPARAGAHPSDQRAAARDPGTRDNVAIAVAERENFAWRTMRYRRRNGAAASMRRRRDSVEMGIGAAGRPPVSRAALRPAAAAGDRDRALAQAHACCCSTSRPPACPRPRPM